jgi:gliding motility-associated-like protein
LLVFYETEIDTTVSSSVVQITAESDGTKEFDVFELLQESFPDLTFENYVISDTVEISIANPDKVSITRILKTSRFVLKFDAITDISPDDYIVVKVCMDDRNACYNLRINLLSIVATELIVYNAVSPNEDGKNDYLHLGNAEFYDNIQVTIFTRQGNVVWENKESYDNDSNYWEGLGENGERLLSGTYFYIIKYSKTEDNGSESMPTLKGYLQLKFDSNGALDNN